MAILYYQNEYEESKSILVAHLFHSGIPKTLWPYYVRLMAEELACTAADGIVSAQLQQANELKGR